MRSDREIPSLPVLAVALVVLGAIAFLFVRSGGSGPRSEIGEALDRSLEAGGSYSGVNRVAAAGRSSDQSFDGTFPAGAAVDDLGNFGPILGNIELLGDVRTAGFETIGGVPTTHYTAEVDPALQAEHYEGREIAPGISADLTKIQARPPHVEVWIDNSGMLRRFFVSESYRDGTIEGSNTFEIFPNAGAG